MRLNLLRGVLAACLAATCLADAPAQDVDDSPPAPPQSAQASDHPLDGGEQIDVTWELSPDDPTPRIRDMLREAGVFEIESLPEDDEAEAQALLEPFAGYWLYRTLTDKPMEVRAWEDALEEIVKTLTDPEEPMAVKRSTLSALLETLRSAPAAETPYDELPNLGEAAAAEIESILEGGADADTDAMTRIASLVESDVFGAIPSSEVEEEYAAEKKTAIKTAKKQVTEQILDEHDLELDEFHDASDEVKAQIREARAAAAEAAAEDVEARARANAGEVHWKLVVDLPPEREQALQVRRDLLARLAQPFADLAERRDFLEDHRSSPSDSGANGSGRAAGLEAGSASEGASPSAESGDASETGASTAISG